MRRLNKFAYIMSRTVNQIAKNLLSLTNEKINKIFETKENKIIMYHSIGDDGSVSISRDKLTRHIEWISQEFKVLDIHQIFDQKEDISMSITFDDGYKSFFNIVRPVLHEYSIPATVFVIGKTLDDPTFTHDGAPLSERSYMTKEQLRVLADDPLVTIGGHSYSHPDLSAIDEEKVLREEIIGGAERIESELGIEIECFAYPGNRWSPQAREIVSEKFKYAVCGPGAGITPDSDPALLPRVNAAVPLRILKFEVSNLAATLRKLSW